MHKFNVGDLVRLNSTNRFNNVGYWARQPRYATYTVEAVSRYGTDIRLKGHDRFWMTSRFDLVSPAQIKSMGIPGKATGTSPSSPSSPSITVVDEVAVGTYVLMLQHPNGDLAPAKSPRKLTTDTQAHKVAKQMSKKHGGKFVIFKAIGEYVPPPQVEPTFRAL